MPLLVHAGAPTLFIRKNAYDRTNLSRAVLDERLNLTDDEFRVEGGVIGLGPIQSTDELPALVDDLEELGLVYFDDFFELSGNWPEWLRLYAAAEDPG